MSHQDHTDSNNLTQAESSGFKCIQLISQVFAELPFLNDNFQTSYNPRNLGVSTSDIKVDYKCSKGHSVTVKSQVWCFFLHVAVSE